MKKTALCLKGLSVETELNPEAVRNTLRLINLTKPAAGHGSELQLD